MKKTIILSLFLFTSYILSAQSIDESAAVRYFQLTDSLKQGYSISQETWKGFLGMEGNKLYTNNQGFSDAYLEKYRKELEIVYKPENDSILQRKLQSPQSNYMTYVIYQYKAHEAVMKAYLAKITAGKEDYIRSMYANAYLMLPKKLQTKNSNTKLYFIGIENDAIAQDGNIVFTLWTAYNYDKVKYGALAGHELHHVLNKPKRYKVAEKDKVLLVILNKILNEGGPDLIDKKYSMQTGFPDDLRFGEYFLSIGKNALPNIDTAIMNMATGVKTYSSKEINQLIGSSGHIPGFYMANIIERNGLRNELIEHIQNPFQFIYLYNKAAKKDKEQPYVFTKQTIQYLQKVETEAKELK